MHGGRGRWGEEKKARTECSNWGTVEIIWDKDGEKSHSIDTPEKEGSG